jgi:hypothetical protein
VYNVGGVINCYSGNILTNRVAITKVITVRSADNDPTNTIIVGAKNNGTNGPAAVRCVYMKIGSSLIGFMLTNGATLASGGATRDTRGGGVCCESDSQIIISNCLITGNSAGFGGGSGCGALYNCTLVSNSADSYGGGVAYSILNNCTIVSNSASLGGGGSAYSTLYNCTLTNNSANSGGGSVFDTLCNCTIVGNSAVNGGGAMSGTLSNCTIVGNSAGSYGGGARQCTLYNCVLTSNSATTGGGGAREGTLYNCTLVGNSATTGGGVRGGGQYLINCIVYFNNPGGTNNWYDTTSIFTHSCTYPTQSTWTASMGNITNNPLFVNTNAGNYRLSQGSPCINAGLNQSWMTGVSDLDGHSRIDRYSGIVDMGCYEYLPAGSMYLMGF